jgi:hypothetical protein
LKPVPENAVQAPPAPPTTTLNILGIALETSLVDGLAKWRFSF